MDQFTIKLDDKPHLHRLTETDLQAFKTIVGTFVQMMELSASERWYELENTIGMNFSTITTAILGAFFRTSDIDRDAFKVFGHGLHPLSLINEASTNPITQQSTVYDWRSHFGVDIKDLEAIIRKLLYIVRFYDIHQLQRFLETSEYIDAKLESEDIKKLPFQPALKYQKTQLGELFVGQFFQDIGAFNCGHTDDTSCPACKTSELTVIGVYKVCQRCNAGFEGK